MGKYKDTRTLSKEKIITGVRIFLIRVLGYLQVGVAVRKNRDTKTAYPTTESKPDSVFL
jgi:hypothetical protein